MKSDGSSHHPPQGFSEWCQFPIGFGPEGTLWTATLANLLDLILFTQVANMYRLAELILDFPVSSLKSTDSAAWIVMAAAKLQEETTRNAKKRLTHALFFIVT